MNSLAPATSKVLLHFARDGVALMAGLPGPASGADPLAARRELVFDDGKGHRAGYVRPVGSLAIRGLGHAEVIGVAAGEIRVDGRPFGPGRAFVLPRGFTGEIEAGPATIAVFVSQESPALAPAETGLIALDPALPRNRHPGPLRRC